MYIVLFRFTSNPTAFFASRFARLLRVIPMRVRHSAQSRPSCKSPGFGIGDVSKTHLRALFMPSNFECASPILVYYSLALVLFLTHAIMHLGASFTKTTYLTQNNRGHECLKYHTTITVIYSY